MDLEHFPCMSVIIFMAGWACLIIPLLSCMVFLFICTIAWIGLQLGGHCIAYDLRGLRFGFGFQL